eukprot:12242587-Alexandrium_andersonii.AAC.1
MSASLVGSEMCIRDRLWAMRCRVQGPRRTTLVVWRVALVAPYGARNTRHSSCSAFPLWSTPRLVQCPRCRVRGPLRTTLVVGGAASVSPYGARHTRHLS